MGRLRSVVFRDGGEVEIGSRTERPMTRFFLEIVAAVRQSLPRRCVIDGEIVITSPDKQGLDFSALQLRLHPAASRVQLLSAQTPALFVAFDLLALFDVNWTSRPFHVRRAALQSALASAVPPSTSPQSPGTSAWPDGGSTCSRVPAWTD